MKIRLREKYDFLKYINRRVVSIVIDFLISEYFYLSITYFKNKKITFIVGLAKKKQNKAHIFTNHNYRNYFFLKSYKENSQYISFEYSKGSLFKNNRNLMPC